MAASKCVKCGAQIPNKADFCPNCGAPKAAARQAVQPVQQPAGLGIGETIEKISSLQMISIGIFIGILLAGIGKLISLTVSGTVGGVLAVIGLNGAGLAMLFGGLFNKNLNPTLRGGLATAGGIMLSVANLITATSFNIGF